MKTIVYYMAPQSPWTWLGHDRMIAIARKHGARIDLRPADLNRVFPVSGGLPLAKRAPQRQAYRLVELPRWSAFTGVPLNLHPKFFPVAGDDASKLIIAATEIGGRAPQDLVVGELQRSSRPHRRRRQHRPVRPLWSRPAVDVANRTRGNPHPTVQA